MPKGIYTRGIIHRSPHSEAAKVRMSLVATGKPKSEAHIKNMSLSKIGIKYPNRKKYFKGVSVFHKICNFCKKDYIADYKNHNRSRYCSVSCRSKGAIHVGMTGKKGGEKQKESARKRKGELHHNWKGGVSSIDKLCRGMPEYKQWRSDVFQRDNWTCQTCGKKGYVTAHHIMSFSILIRFYDIKTTEDARKCKELWDTKNGVTLCEECHKLTDNYAGRIKKN